MKLILTIDTEADNQWDVNAELTTGNLAYIPRFQALCDRYDFRPTYLCTYEVVTDSTFDQILLPYVRMNRAEVGSHLHPWSTPPFDDQWDAKGARAYPSELPAELVESKLDRLTAVLRERTGVGPTSYRAGRWGFSPAQIPILTKLGYLADCSVTPLTSWTRDTGLKTGGPDFTKAPLAPYVLSSRSTTRAGSSGLLEVPVTILHTSRLMRRSHVLRDWCRRHRQSVIMRVGDRLLDLRPQWFRPYPRMSADRLIAVYETARVLGLPVIEMMLHSSELMPGGSPYNQSEEAVNGLFQRLDTTLRHLHQHQVDGITLSEYARSRSSSVDRSTLQAS